MSLFLDQKYLLLVGNKLPLFKKLKDSTYNCRCIICGDSSKKKTKARGYFFPHNNSLRYKCHNCDASLSFGNFLKTADSLLYQQYSLEKYTEGKPLTKNDNTFKFEEPVFQKEERLIDKIMDRLDKLPEDHEAILYCKTRKIPSSQFRKLYFIPNIKDVVQLNESYKESIRTEEPRLVLPMYDDINQLSGLICRAMRGEALRYLTIKIKENTPLIFGLNDVDKAKDVFVLEGPIDSLFIENSIAVAGTSVGKVNQTNLDKDKMVVVFDNQPRNKEVCKIISNTIENGFKVVIWPQNIMEKDVNDMVLAGKNVNKIVKENVFCGLEAKAKFIAWKRC